MNTFTMKPLLGGKEIRFLNRQESSYPNLARLCMDFGFRVFETLHRDGDTPSKAVLLVSSDYSNLESGAITPCFADLKTLEAHVEYHMVDILHDYLFGSVDDVPLSRHG